MTSAYTALVILALICALVVALVWLSYMHGRVTILKEHATTNIAVKQEAENDMEKLKKLPAAELDAKLSEWMRED